MNYNQLGNSEIRVSELSFGCMSLGTDDSYNANLLRYAFEKGINFFDTADLYNKGQNEETVGKALREIRSDVIIASKVGNQWREDGSGWDWNPSKEYILSSIDKSLKRLQTDYLDLYQLHGGTTDDPIDETIEAFELLKEQGKIREYGISSIRPNVIREWISRSNMISVMSQYSLLDRRPEEETFKLLKENNISVLVRGAVAQGLLIDKPPKEYLGYTEKQVLAMQRLLKELGNPVSQSMAFVLDNPAVTASVLGLRTEEQLEQSLEALAESIIPEQIELIRSLLFPNTYQIHR
ncbi:MAG: aldo/keto reductase [Balneola sp.]|nr:MAG: aldo/keto reductase [Balneola sp.]